MINLRPIDMRVDGRYNWKGRPERLIYLGRNWSGNGYWHQFEKVGAPGVIWCEVLDSQLLDFEETPAVQPDIDQSRADEDWFFHPNDD